MNNKGKIYLIGTDHCDEEGPRKLLKVYDEIKPNVILEEMSEVDLKRWNGLVSELEKKLESLQWNEEKLKAFREDCWTGIWFEGKVNEEYSKKNKVPQYMVDLPGSHKRVQSLVRYKINNLLNRHKILNDSKAQLISAQKNNYYFSDVKKKWDKYKKYEGTLKGELLFIFPRLIGLVGKRDRYMELRIREIYGDGKIIAFPIGMAHILKSITKNTLYSRINDLNPERIPLI